MSDTIDFGVYTGIQWEQLSSEYLHGLADMGNSRAQAQLDSMYNSPIEDQKIGFGKYVGYKWIDLKVDYLYWILENVDTNNIKYILATKALRYIEEYNSFQDDVDVIYVD